MLEQTLFEGYLLHNIFQGSHSIDPPPRCSYTISQSLLNRSTQTPKCHVSWTTSWVTSIVINRDNYTLQMLYNDHKIAFFPYSHHSTFLSSLCFCLHHPQIALQQVFTFHHFNRMHSLVALVQLLPILLEWKFNLEHFHEYGMDL